MNNFEDAIEPIPGESAESFLERIIEDDLKDVAPDKREARRKEIVEGISLYLEGLKKDEEQAIRYAAQELNKQELLKKSPEEKLHEVKRFFQACKQIIEEQVTTELLLRFNSDGPLDNTLACNYESGKNADGSHIPWIKPVNEYFYYMIDKLKIEPLNLNLIAVSLDLDRTARRDMHFITIYKDDTFEKFLKYYGHSDISHYEFLKELEEKMPPKDIAKKKLKI